MLVKNISKEESREENLTTWALERGTRFEHHNLNAAHNFIEWINKKNNLKNILELGCGDGIALNVFHKAGFNTTGVDINEKKLCQIEAGPRIVKEDMYEFLFKDFAKIDNVFTHHALEHTPKADVIIKVVGERMSSGSIYYAVVPADDYLHSVHHVVFESAEELLPPYCEPLLLEKRDRFGEKEFICIAQKT